jgi:serine beta-lactamase-like protein LACTB, mitochondrial
MSRRTLLFGVGLGAGLLAAAAAALSLDTGTPARRETAACSVWLADREYAAAVREARALLPRLWRGLRAPGLTVAAAVEGKVVWSAGCGYADRERRLPVLARTRFRIGSLSKPLTSAGLARLHDEGRLDLDAEIQRYVPRFPRKSAPIDIRQLAGHLAGLRGNDASELVNRRRFRSVAEEIELFAADPLVQEPGTSFSYSNAGWALLGAAIEGASHRSYGDYMRMSVLGPLGLRETELGDSGERIPNQARPYEVTDTGRAVVAPRHDLSIRWPSGGFVSTSEDVARFGSRFVGGSFVSPATVRTFLTSQRTRSGRATGYGLGWEVRPSPLGVFAGHTGNAVGGTAALLVHLQSGVAFALTTNLGYVTAGAPPPPRAGTPEPPAFAAPFIHAVLAARGTPVQTRFP